MSQIGQEKIALKGENSVTDQDYLVRLITAKRLPTLSESIVISTQKRKKVANINCKTEARKKT